MFKINPEISIKKIADEIFIYDRKNAFIHSFNDTGVLIIESIQKQMNLEQICQQIVTQFEIDPEEARKDTIQFIENLVQNSIISK